MSIRSMPCSSKRAIRHRRWRYLPALLLLVIPIGCGASDESIAYDAAPGAVAQMQPSSEMSADQESAEEAVDVDFYSDASAQAEGEGGEGADGANVDASADEILAVVDPSRRIIKDGTMAILVDDVELGLSRVESIATGAGGYVLETSTDYARYDGRHATMRLAVPAEAFEDSMQRIREVAREVESESSSGKDVTQEYVDLQGQIANLEATRARVREFLDQAESVEEALNVNARLTEIEGQIAERKGRLRYLAQRSAMSTIVVALREPESEAEPWPTPTPAPLPDWSPKQTAGEAFTTLRLLSRGLASLAIWLGIVGLPLALPVLAVLWLLRRLWRAWRRRDD